MTRDLISNCGQCFTILAISINFATKVRCFYPLSVVFPFSRICCCFPRLSVTVAGWGKEEGRWGKDGPVREFLSSRTPHPGAHTQVDICSKLPCESSPFENSIFRENFLRTRQKAPPSRCPNHLKVKSSIFNNLPNIIPDIYIAQYTWAICPFGGTHLTAL